MKGYFFHNPYSNIPLPNYENDSDTIFIVFMAQERYKPVEVNCLIEYCENSNYKKCMIFLDDVMKKCAFDKGIKTSIYFIPFFAFKSYKNCFNINQVANQTYNVDKNKALFLIGKLHKQNRIGLLYKFYKKNLLNFIDYSAYGSESTFKISYDYLPEKISELEYDRFVNSIQKSLDKINIEYTPEGINGGYRGFPYDPEIYANTSLSIVSETECTANIEHPFITEKLYRTIFNKHPFIVASNANYLKVLRQMELKTFDNYFKYNYDDYLDIWQRLDMIVENTVDFLSKLENPEFSEMVKQDVEFNFNLLYNKMNDLDNYLISLGVDTEKLTSIHP